MRRLSYSEISTALTCLASWDFRYSDRLAGSALKRREVAPILSDGRAWGAGVAAWHANYAEFGMVEAVMRASEAMTRSYAEDRAEMAEAGWVPNLEKSVDQRNRLDDILAHYVSTAEPFPNLTRLEGEIRVPLWSRTRKGHSNRYAFTCFVDGWVTQYLNHTWLAEFKIRSSLYDADLLALSRQPRWYAWSLRELQRQLGIEDLVGAIVDERWNEPPAVPRIIKNGSVSTDKRQRITPLAYEEACRERGQKIDPLMIDHLRDIRWQQRIPILFRDGELDEAGEELISAAKLIRDLDSGELYPIRNARPSNCRPCEFKRICPNPSDRLLVDTQFLRRPPKRLRVLENEEATHEDGHSAGASPAQPAGLRAS